MTSSLPQPSQRTPAHTPLSHSLPLSEPVANAGHNRGPARGLDEAITDLWGERQQVGQARYAATSLLLPIPG